MSKGIDYQANGKLISAVFCGTTDGGTRLFHILVLLEKPDEYVVGYYREGEQEWCWGDYFPNDYFKANEKFLKHVNEAR